MTLTPPALTLALWQVRETWRLLLVIGAAMAIAVLLVCSVPTYSRVTLTAGMRDVLSATPLSPDIIVRGGQVQLASRAFAQGQQQTDSDVRSYLAPYLSGPASVFVQAPPMAIDMPLSADTQQNHLPIAPDPRYARTADTLVVNSLDMAQAAAHLHLIAGRLPQAQTGASALEIALTQPQADALHATVGATLPIEVAFRGGPDYQAITQVVPASVVGLVSFAASDIYWAGADYRALQTGVGYAYQAFSSIDGLLALVSNLVLTSRASLTDPTTLYVLGQPVVFTRVYRLNAAHLTIDQLDDLNAQLSGYSTFIGNTADTGNGFDGSGGPASLSVSGDAIGDGNTLQAFSDRAAAPEIPIVIFLIEVAGLALFFISIQSDLLIERQGSAIVTMRSRGATRWQIFNALALQGFGLALLALVIGLALVIPTVTLLTRQTLPRADLGALNIIGDHPLAALLALRWYALGMVGVALLALLGSINMYTQLDVLAMRREAARSQRLPLWRRLNLDLLAAVVALVGYGASLLVARLPGLDAQTQTLLSPIRLIAPFFLLLAMALLFLRFFPSLLEGGLRLASRGRGAAPQLALAQIARAPSGPMRMALLLTLSTALAIFTLVFSASQAQRIADVSTYQAASDFSGYLPTAIDTSQTTSAQITQRFAALSGVRSVALGYRGATTLPGAQAQIELQAVDPTTYGATALWPASASQTSLATLMQRLYAARSSSKATNRVPAIVDASIWDALQLHMGQSFSVKIPGLSNQQSVTFVAIAEIAHLPPVADTTAVSLRSLGSGYAGGGLLVDYQRFSEAYASYNPQVGLAPNYIWLRTTGSAEARAHVRAALLTQRDVKLGLLRDRGAVQDSLLHDPLYLDLLGVFTLGAITALGLALAGDLIASWLSARGRLTTFAMQRALGAEPRQIGSVLLWEQGLVYGAAIALGFLLGGLLAFTAVPSLVFTGLITSGSQSAISSTEYFARQQTPPAQVVLPSTLFVVLAILVGICALAVILMTRIVSRPSISQTLRLNED